MNNRFFGFAEIFVAVVRCRSMTTAASELKTTKSNISQKLSDFEKLLDVALLRRTTRRISLTPAGNQVFELCVGLVDAATETASEIGIQFSAPEAARGRVTLSGANTYLSKLVMPKMPAFLSAHPNVRPVLVGSDRRVNFAEENVDLGIRIGPAKMEDALARPLRPLERVLCASPDFLSRYAAPDHPTRLSAMPCVLREQEQPKWSLQSGQVRCSHEIPKPVLVVNTVEMAHEAALCGVGLCLLARVIVEGDFLSGRLRPVLPEWRCDPIDVTLFCRRSRITRPQVKVFHRFLVDHFA